MSCFESFTHLLSKKLGHKWYLLANFLPNRLDDIGTDQPSYSVLHCLWLLLLFFVLSFACFCSIGGHLVFCGYCLVCCDYFLLLCVRCIVVIIVQIVGILQIIGITL